MISPIRYVSLNTAISLPVHTWLTRTVQTPNTKTSSEAREEINTRIHFPPSSNSLLNKSIPQITPTRSLTVCNLPNQSAQIHLPASRQAGKEGKEVNSMKSKITQPNPTIEKEKMIGGEKSNFSNTHPTTPTPINRLNKKNIKTHPSMLSKLKAEKK